MRPVWLRRWTVCSATVLWPGGSRRPPGTSIEREYGLEPMVRGFEAVYTEILGV